MKWKRAWYLIKSDIWRRVLNNGHSHTKTAFVQTALSPSCLAVILFRLQHYFYTNNLYIFTKIIAVANIILFSVEIGSQCEIEEGFCLGHANGTVIHERTRIGKNCTIMHQTGLGFKQLEDLKENEFLILEDNVLVGAGVRFLGPLTIGQGSIVGMNSLVMHSAPADSLIVGYPAKVIRTLTEEDRGPAENISRNWQKRPACSLKQTLKLIQEDLKHRCKLDGKPFSRSAYLRLLLNPPAMAVVLFRFSHWLDGHGFSLIVKMLNAINVILFKTEIGAKASIKGGLVLLHSNGVLINHQTRIGKNVIFAHHNSVAIGPRRGMNPHTDFVSIGDNSFVGGGARIVGNLTIGKNCLITMNTVVTKSAPDNTILFNDKNKIKSASQIPPPKPETPIKPISLHDTIDLIKADISRRARLDGKKAGLFYYCKLFLNPPAMAVVLFRLSHYTSRKKWHPAAKILYLLNNILFSVEIQSQAQIGPGLILAHANGILIHDTSIIGKNCTFMFQNTLTVAHTKDDRVILGDNIIIGMGARIIGPVQIGSHSLISANAVVTKDAPEKSVLFGIPARKISTRKAQ